MTTSHETEPAERGPNRLNRTPGKFNLSCGHEVIFSPPPEPSDLVFCYRCDDYRPVEEVHRWIASCSDCLLSRSFMAPQLAVDKAYRHIRLNNSHTVMVMSNRAKSITHQEYWMEYGKIKHRSIVTKS